MAVYTRQYTQGVGWENEPSLNTPISAENLNQMDSAIQDVDEAAYNAFNNIESKQRNRFRHAVMTNSGAVIALQCGTIVDAYNSIDDLHDGDILVLYVSNAISLSSGSTWKVQAYKKVGASSTVSILKELRDANGANITSGFSAGSLLFMLYDATNNYWKLQEIIASSGGGGARVFSDHITSQDDTNLLTSTAIIGSGDEKEGDIVFLTCDINAVWTNPPAPLEGWGVNFGAYGAGGGGGTIVDYRNGSWSTFTPNITSGTILVISKINSTLWALRMLITPSAGDSSIKTFGCTVSSITAFSNTLSPSNFSFQSADDAPADGDIIICRIEDSGSLTGATTTWGFSYEVDGVTASHTMIDARNGQAVGFFSDGIKAGTVLVLKYVSGYIYVIGSTISSDFTLRTCHGTANGDNIEIAESFRSISENDIIFVTITADATIHTWYIRYNIGGMYELAQIYDELNGTPTSPEYRAALTAGDILILTRKYNFMAKIPAGSAGASTLADLTDTDISSPAAGQVLMYNGTEWENAEIPAPAVATSAAVGVVKPDNETITIDNDGTIHGQEIVPVGAGYWTISNGKATWVGGEITGSWTVANGKATWVPAS